MHRRTLLILSLAFAACTVTPEEPARSPDDGGTRPLDAARETLDPLQQSVRYRQAIFESRGYAVGLRAEDSRIVEIVPSCRTAGWIGEFAAQAGLEFREMELREIDLIVNLPSRTLCGTSPSGDVACTNVYSCGDTPRPTSIEGCVREDECTPPPGELTGLGHGCALRPGTGHAACWLGANGDTDYRFYSVDEITGDVSPYWDRTVERGCALVFDDGLPGIDPPTRRFLTETYTVHCWDAGTVPSPPSFVRIDHNCGILEGSGEIRCWLDGSVEAVADDDSAWPRNFPEGAFTDISVDIDGRRACAIRAASGDLVCWGAEPMTAPPSGSFVDVELFSYLNGCALRSGGGIECWSPAAPDLGFDIPSTDVRFAALARGGAGALTEDGRLVRFCVRGDCAGIRDDDPCYRRDSSGDVLCNYMDSSGRVVPPPPPPVPMSDGGVPSRDAASDSFYGSCIVRNVVADPDITPGCTEYYDGDAALRASCDDSLLTTWLEGQCPNPGRWAVMCRGATIGGYRANDYWHPESTCSAGSSLRSRCASRGGTFCGVDCDGSRSDC